MTNEIECIDHEKVLHHAALKTPVTFAELQEALQYVTASTVLSSSFCEIVAFISQLRSHGVSPIAAAKDLNRINETLKNPTESALEKLERLGVQMNPVNGVLNPIPVLHKLYRREVEASDIYDIFNCYTWAVNASPKIVSFAEELSRTANGVEK